LIWDCNGLGASIPIRVLRIQSEEQRQKDQREFKGASCYERTRDQGTLGSVAALAIIEPLGRTFLMYISIRLRKGLLRYSGGSRDSP
jgi:hypothetical protein